MKNGFNIKDKSLIIIIIIILLLVVAATIGIITFIIERMHMYTRKYTSVYVCMYMYEKYVQKYERRKIYLPLE